MALQPGDLPPSDSEHEIDVKGNNGGESESEGESGELPANPNHTASSRKQLEKTDEEETKPKKDLSQLSRREREALEAQQARERYMKLHAEGKTEEARSDLARLALIREQRESERARKQAEKEEKEAVAKEKAAAREALLSKKTTNKKGGGKKK
ncbi:PDGFA associated 1 family protein [Aspergillus ruber CBS 135680]|uniref:Casein kinase substrate phosphoprotein PP28 domain-containing protein n=1 Tax=Aspergillus ruber (strain CBS 135680) TaxID=1388766 RepID=A0A017SHQ0_ASPRC|nr:uncharacterized protein EURHEDRAFT_411449 [Aspergillus ruber CBS 135680]EYE96286.1 hypothetical protein EURHEDRAFT_411449 [Aspergillus ruber CBS 135680]